MDPAITQAVKRSSNKERCTSAGRLHRATRIDLPLYDLTTGTGDYIANGVCNRFRRPSHTYLNFDAGRDFERKIVVKVNAPEVLRRELRKKSWTGAHVAMGTNTDPYQRCEGRYRLTRGCWRCCGTTPTRARC